MRSISSPQRGWRTLRKKVDSRLNTVCCRRNLLGRFTNLQRVFAKIVPFLFSRIMEYFGRFLASVEVKFGRLRGMLGIKMLVQRCNLSRGAKK